LVYVGGMADNLKCNFCSKPATVHLTQIMNGKVQKIDLCEECAQNKGIADPSGFSLSDLLGKTIGTFGEKDTSSLPVSECSHCGYTAENAQKIGRLGCPDCYNEFASIITPTLGSMHKRTVHIGKVPHRSLERHEYLSRIHALNVALQRAVTEERYEDAARLRDELNQLKTLSTKEGSHAD
jgi:protein arginine kinase activator